MTDPANAADVAQAGDKSWAKPPKGVKMLSHYLCLGRPLLDQPPNTFVTVAVIEAESAEAMTAVTYPSTLAGASIWYVPVQEMPVGGAAKVEKEARGSAKR